MLSALYAVAALTAGASCHQNATRGLASKPENPYRFNEARYKCAAEGEQCACDGPVTWHLSSTPAPPAVAKH